MCLPNDIEVQEIIDRSNFLRSNPPRCEYCGTDQVQLKDSTKPAGWKCRRCKTQWWQEPEDRGGKEWVDFYATRSRQYEAR